MRTTILFVFLLPVGVIALLLSATLSFVIQLTLLPSKILWHIRDYDSRQHKLKCPEKDKEKL